MKNILFIAPYRQNDGWGLAAKDYARALMATNNNVAIRPIYMSNSIQQELEPELQALENNTFQNYDIVIEKVLPHLFVKTEVPTLGLFTLETTNASKMFWWPYMQMMDGIMVPSNVEASDIIKGGLQKCYAISEPMDISIFNWEYEWFDGIPKDTFNFYFIGEFTDRKNLDALLIAFHREFQTWEPVNLVIKINKSGYNPFALNDLIDSHITSLKKKLRIYQQLSYYKQELIITQWLNPHEMCSLHSSCHCFVMPSRGEAFCRPAVDSMGFGNQIITTANTGMSDYTPEHYQINSELVPVQMSNPPLNIIYTGRELWSEPNILHLQHLMRKAFKENKLKDKPDMTRFSYKEVGNNIQRVINI